MNTTDGVQKPFDASQAMLRERLLFFLDRLHPALEEDILYALKGPGKLFHSYEESIDKSTPPAGVWSLLPLLVAQYVAPNIDARRACTVSVAIECFICALDLLDDIEDDDQTSIVVHLGVARVLNVSTTLLALANHIILSLSDLKVPHALVFTLSKTLQEASLRAVTGQHHDILAEQRSAESLTFEECIEIAEGKAGTLMSLACLVGAMCAGASSEYLLLFSEMGKLLGIAHQLDNDSHDLYHIIQYQHTHLSTGTVKTDLIRKKKTLPIVLAAHMIPNIEDYFEATNEEKHKVLVHALREGITTAWGISLLYRERAHEQLRQIEVQYSLSHSLHLLLGFL